MKVHLTNPFLARTRMDAKFFPKNLTDPGILRRSMVRRPGEVGQASMRQYCCVAKQGSARRERMRAFRGSGVLGTPVYMASLKRVGGMLLIGLVVCAYAVIAYDPHTFRFGVGLVFLLGCVIGSVFWVAGYRSHRAARTDADRHS